VARTLHFCFEELPLLIEAGFEAGDMTGSAEISYHRDGEWSIRAIALDAGRRRSPAEMLAAARSDRPLSNFERRPLRLEEGDPIYLRIYHRLEHEWRGRVETAVIDQLAADRDSAADERADYRRALRATR
jgi:hypothetical protein